MRYNTFRTSFTHRTTWSETRRQNSAIVTVWGEGEFAVKQGIEKEFPEAVDIVIVEMAKQ